MIRNAVLSGLVGLLCIGSLPAEEPERKVEKQVYIFASGGSWLGLNIGDVDAARATELGMDGAAGAEIRSVVPDSPADEAGLAEGDVILQYQGTRIEGVRQLTRLVRETPAGRVANLQVFRDGSTRMVPVKVAKREGKWDMKHGGGHHVEGLEGLEGLEALEGYEMPDIQIPHIEMPDINIPRILEMAGLRSSARLGVIVDELTEQLGQFFGVEDGKGVLVRSVVKGGRAEAAGVKAGDVIVEIDNLAIADVSDLRHAIRERRGKEIELIVVRDKSQKRLSVAASKDTDTEESSGGEFIWHDDDSSHRTTIEDARRSASMARRDFDKARQMQADVRREMGEASLVGIDTGQDL